MRGVHVMPSGDVMTRFVQTKPGHDRLFAQCLLFGKRGTIGFARKGSGAIVLYEVDRHEPLTSASWDEPRVRRCIGEILRDAVDRYNADTLWPAHPKEDLPPTARGNLYAGAAGVIWALNDLAGRALSIELPDFATAFPNCLDLNNPWLDAAMIADNPLAAAGLLNGNTGIRLVQLKCAGLPYAVEDIATAIDANRDNPACDFMWASPGTMLASLWLHEWMQRHEWADRFRRDAALLWNRLEFVPEVDCHLWRQHLYGHEAFHIGAAHGFAGNAFPVIRGWHLLSRAEQNGWSERLTHALRQTAMLEDDCANWPQSVVKNRPGRTAMLVQHCHGAPGIVNCFADFPESGIDDLLVAAGEMTWRAGPLRKGSGLCHGTAGNGYAFLKLFRRTGEALWLERARRFAMHAIEQQRMDARTYGQDRYTLWTGDPGLAIYLWDCINATDRFPTMDKFFETG